MALKWMSQSEFVTLKTAAYLGLSALGMNDLCLQCSGNAIKSPSAQHAIITLGLCHDLALKFLSLYWDRR